MASASQHKIQGFGFAPDSLVTVAVHSSVLSFEIQGPDIHTDENGALSLSDGSVSNSRAPNAYEMVAVTDASGNQAVARWGAKRLD